MDYVAITDVGKKRTGNEDFLFASDKQTGILPNLFIVADGMGGHNAGEIASQLCTESIVEHIRTKSAGKDIATVLVEAVSIANDNILAEAYKDTKKIGMGTTVVICSCFEDHVLVASVGDSRLYLQKDGVFTQITRDHTLVSEMLRMGSISKSAAKTHPKRHMLTRAVGVMEHVDVDLFKIPLDGGEQILMATDGLTNMVSEEKLSEIISKECTKEQKAKSLLTEALDNGGEDNITFIIVGLKE